MVLKLKFEKRMLEIRYFLERAENELIKSYDK